MKRKTLTIGRTLTINLGNFESDRPHAEITVEIDEDDNLADCVAELIDEVNTILMATHESDAPNTR